MTSPAGNTEPTAEQLAVALSCGNWRPCDYDHLSDDDRWLINNFARALAAAVTAERDKYLRVADELDAEGRKHAPLGYNGDLMRAARRIREVRG